MNKRRALFIVLLLLIPLGFLGLITSQTGSQWLLRQVLSFASVQLADVKMTGRLLDQFSLTNVEYKSDTKTISFDKLAIRWQPEALLWGRLHLLELTIDGLQVSLSDTAKPQKADKFALNLPLQMTIENASLNRVSYQSGDLVQNLEKLQFAIDTDGDQLKILALTINDAIINARAEGHITLNQDLDVNATAAWQLNTEQNGVLQGATAVSGNLKALSFSHRVSSPFQLAVEGNLDDLDSAPRIAANAVWHNLVWPLTAGTPQIKSDQGSIEVSGLLSEYQISLNGQLSQQYLPDASLNFTGKGSQTAMTIEKLTFASPTGSFLLSGDISWHDVPRFAIAATAKDLNPAIFLPEMPGQLTFDSKIAGELGDRLRLDAELANLTGQLRGTQVNAHGKLLIDGDQFNVDNVEMRSGVNSLSANGNIGQSQSTLKLRIDAPALHTLHPALAGSVKGAGVMQGNWQNPAINLQLQAKGLRIAERRAEQIAIDLDYAPDAAKTSKLLFSAKAIKTADLQLDSAQLEGGGSLAQHHFEANLNSGNGTIAAALTGSFLTGKWQANLAKLDIFNQENGLWQLKRPPTITVTNSPQGLDTSWSEACLAQNNAGLCTQGRYQANGDFNATVLASALPTQLLKPFLQAEVALTGTLNADTELSQQQGLLNGRFQVGMSPATLSLNDKTLALGASSVSGTIKANMLSTTFDVALAQQDYLRGQLLWQMGKSQAIGGQLSASIRELAVAETFLPQLSATQGLLTADLSIKGTIQNPIVMGQLNLSQGSVNLVDQGFGLRNMTLNAVASGNQPNSIELTGSLLPELLNTTHLSESIEFNGLINLHADLQQQKGALAGRYRIDSPPLSISLQNREGSTKIPVAASSLTGSIDGNAISADLDLKLADQDYLHSQLNLDSIKQTLSGTITASIENLSLLNPLVPQLLNIKGNLKADLAVQGTLTNPLAKGEIQFIGDAIEVNDLGITLRELRLKALASGDIDQRMQISGSAKSGDGAINIDGFASLQAEAGWPFELTLLGDNFELAKMPEAQIALSPNLKLAYAHKQGTVTGRLKVPKAIITLQEFPENAVKVSADEIIIGEEHQAEQTQAAPGLDVNIELELGEQVSFSGRGLNTELAGKLQLTKAAEKISLFGKIDMLKARYKSYGQDLTVRQGRLVFNGPVDDPWVDVEAIRLSKNRKVTAILGLSGSLQKPQTRIYADPALPESEALAYLVTGRSLSQVSKAEGNMLASAAMSYAGGHAAWITDKLGIDEFDVQEGETLQDTLVTMGEYLTPDFYLGTKVGLFNKQAVMVLKHNITDAINLETQAGTSQRIKLNYEIDKD
jgi:translocation and assembly module TamB